jgi:AAA family ATP:ADP antiporter
MTEQNVETFSRWRNFLWPVHRYELKKVIPMLLMFFCICFNYTILRDTKDALIVTAPGSGAEAIPFIKVWLVVPVAILFMLVYAKLSNILSKQALFYTSMAPFLIFFVLFGFVLYPARDLLHPTESADFLESVLPAGFKGLIAIYRNWTFSTFYVLAELWGSVMLSLTYWGFANQTTRVSEAKRFYALFGVGGNTAPFFSGLVILYISGLRTHLPDGMDAWGVSLKLLTVLITVMGLIIAGSYWWMNRYVLTDPRFFDPEDIKKSKAKPKMSLKESFLFLSKSRYLGCLAILVIAYGIAINLIEVTWKSQLKLQYPDPNDYSAFMGYFSTIMGCVSFFMALFVGGNIIRRFGWGVAAQITPVVLLITGTGFFAFVLFNEHIAGMISMIAFNPLTLAIIFGTIQNIMCKASKYALFDPTKEIAYIPLDEESKVKGKAAIDVVAARLGKSGGSLVQQGLLITLGSIGAMTPYIALILLFVIGAWMVAASALNKRFTALNGTKKPIEPLQESPSIPIKTQARPSNS